VYFHLVMVDLLHGDQATTDSTVEYLFTVGYQTQAAVSRDVARLIPVNRHRQTDTGHVFTNRATRCSSERQGRHACI